MNNTLKIISVATLSLVISACSSTSEDKPEPNAGFLSNYSLLKEVDRDDDALTKLYRSESIDKTKYDSIIIENIDYFPELPSSPQIPAAVAEEIKNNIDTNIKEALASKFKITDTASPTTAKLRLAITGLTVDDKELAYYQYIPISFLITAVSGSLNDMSVKIQIEAEFVDSTTGEVITAFTKVENGEVLENDEEQLTFDHVSVLLERWFISLNKIIKK